MTVAPHIPVLLDEVIAALAPTPGAIFVDAAMPIHQTGIVAHHAFAYHGRHSQSASLSRGAAGSVGGMSAAVFIDSSSQPTIAEILSLFHHS